MAQLFPRLVRWPRLRTAVLAGLGEPCIRGTHPHSARRGRTSTNFIHSCFSGGGDAPNMPQGPPLQRRDSGNCSFPSPTQASITKIHFNKCDMYGEPVPCKLHLRGIQMLSGTSFWGSPLSLNRLKNSLYKGDPSEMPTLQGSPLKQSRHDLYANTCL